MADNTLGYFYDFLGLSNLKVNYDFSALSGSAIPSLSPGLSIHSGIPTNTTLLNGSGFLSSGSSIRISNVDTGFDALGTHIFNFERTGTLGSGLLFSSLRTGTLNSGYNIGLTDSNLLFFEYIGASGRTVVNSDIILADKNAVAVSIGNNNVSFNHFDFNSKQLEINTRQIKSNELLFSDQWNLRGVGNAVGNYLYFNKNIPNNSLARLFSGLYVSNTTSPAISGSYTYNEVIGYSNSGNPLENSFSLSFSGFDSDFFRMLDGQFGNNVLWGKIEQAYLVSGGVSSGISEIPSGSYAAMTTGSTGAFTGDYLPFYYGDFVDVFRYSGGVNTPYTGSISGYFILFDQSDLYCPTQPVFTFAETGPVGNSFLSTPIIATQTGFYEISAATSGITVNSGVLASYGMSRVSYLWQTGSDSIEQFVFTGGRQTQTYNQEAVFDSVEGEFSAGDFYPSGNCNVFLNGLFQLESGYSVGGNIFNPTYTALADYFTDEQFFNTNQFADSDDLLVYDYEQQQNRIVVPNVYTGANLISGNTYPLNNKYVFLNGQKLLSGVDYTYNGTNFSGESSIRSISGYLVFTNTYTGSYQYTGGYNYTGLTLPRFSRGSSIYYLNGIRLDKSLFVEHSRYDKITGNYVFDESPVLLTDSDFSL